MSKPFDVYGLGNAIIDLQLHVSDEELVSWGLQKGSMKLIELDEEKRLVSFFKARDIRRSSGGSAANTCIAVAQLGGTVAYGCIVGEDELGRFYQREMEEIGVKLHNRPYGGHPTGTSIILITPDAERTMNTHLGATKFFGPEHVSEELIGSAKWLYIEGYLFSTPEGRAAVEKAVEIAKAKAVRIAVSFSDGFIAELFKESLTQAVAASSLIFANVNEAKTFVGETDDATIFAALKRVTRNAVMTRGEKGAFVHFEGRDIEVGAFKVRAVDETGAGDMFAAAFLNGIVGGLELEHCAKRACFLAGRVVAQMGARLHGDVRTIAQEMPSE